MKEIWYNYAASIMDFATAEKILMEGFEIEETRYKAYYRRNKEKIAERLKSNETKAQKRAWYWKNRDKILAAAADRRKRRKERQELARELAISCDKSQRFVVA